MTDELEDDEAEMLDPMAVYEEYLELLTDIGESFAANGPPSTWSDRDGFSSAEQASHDELYAAWARDPIAFLTPPPPLPPPETDAEHYQRQVSSRAVFAEWFSRHGDPAINGSRFGLHGVALENAIELYVEWQRDPAAFLALPASLAMQRPPTDPQFH